MAVNVTEKAKSPKVSAGNRASATREYVIDGTNDENAALTALINVAPVISTVNGLNLIRSTIGVEPEYLDDGNSTGTWNGSVNYETAERKPPKKGNPPVISWDTAGENRHLSFSIQTRSMIGAFGTDPKNFSGAIGVQNSGGELQVQGTDVGMGKYAWQETWCFNQSDITVDYQKSLAKLAFHTNQAPFRGFDTDEVLFMGASGSTREGVVEITYKFAAGENRRGIPVPEKNPVMLLPEKRAWDYMWVFFQDKVEDNQLVRQPLSAYAEQVYEQGDFSSLGI